MSKMTRTELRRMIREELVKASDLDDNGMIRLQSYVAAADEHPEFSGYDLVKGAERDKARLAITDDAGNVVGFMTPVFDRGYWRTGAIYTDPSVRGKGYARKAILQFFSDPAHWPGRAWIADENLLSQRAFTGAGFVRGARRDLGHDSSDKGHDYYLDDRRQTENVRYLRALIKEQLITEAAITSSFAKQMRLNFQVKTEHSEEER